MKFTQEQLDSVAEQAHKKMTKYVTALSILGIHSQLPEDMAKKVPVPQSLQDSRDEWVDLHTKVHECPTIGETLCKFSEQIAAEGSPHGGLTAEAVLKYADSLCLILRFGMLIGHALAEVEALEEMNKK